MAPRIRIALVKRENQSATQVPASNDNKLKEIVARISRQLSAPVNTPHKQIIEKSAAKNINNAAIDHSFPLYKRGISTDKLYSVGLYQLPREARPPTDEERFYNITMQLKIMDQQDHK